MADEKIEKLADEITNELLHLKEEVKKVKGVKGVINVLPDVVKAVEVSASNVKLASDAKRELAIVIINKLIDVPYVPEVGEAVLIGLAIDTLISAFNKLFGKNWLDKVS